MYSDVVTVAVVISLTSVAILGSFLILRFCIRQMRKGKEWNRNYLQFLQTFFGRRSKRLGKFASKHPQFWEGLGYRHPSQQSLQTHSSLDSSFASSKTSSTSYNDIYSKITDDKKNRKSSYIRRSIRKIRQTIRNRRHIRLATHHRAYSHDHIYVSKIQTSSSGKTSSAENSQTYIKNTKFKKKSQINTLGSLNEIPLVTNKGRSNSIISLPSISSETLYRSGSSLKDELSLSVSSLKSAISEPLYYRRSSDINNIEIVNTLSKSGRSVSSDHIYSQISKKGSRSGSSLIIPQTRPHSFPNDSFNAPQFDLHNRTQSLSILPDSSQNSFSIQNSHSGIEINCNVMNTSEISHNFNTFNSHMSMNTASYSHSKYIGDERSFAGSQISLEGAIQSNLPRTRNPIYIQRKLNGCHEEYRMKICNNQNGLESTQNMGLDNLHSTRRPSDQVSLSKCKIISDPAIQCDDTVVYEKFNPNNPLSRNTSQSRRNLEEPMPIPDTPLYDNKFPLDKNCKYIITTTAEVHNAPFIETESTFQNILPSNSSREDIPSHLEHNIKMIFPDQTYYEINEQIPSPKEKYSHCKTKTDMNRSTLVHTPWKHRYLNHPNKILPDKFRTNDSQTSNKYNDQNKIMNYNENTSSINKNYPSALNPNKHNRKYESSSAINLESRNTSSKYESNPKIFVKSNSDVIYNKTHLTERVPSPYFNKRYFGVENYPYQQSSPNIKNKGKCHHEKHSHKPQIEYNLQNRLPINHICSQLKNKQSNNNKHHKSALDNVISSNDLFFNSNNYTTTYLPNQNNYEFKDVSNTPRERVSIIDIFGSRSNNNDLNIEIPLTDNQVENSENELNLIRNNVNQKWRLEENNDIYSSIPYRESITSIGSEDLEMLYNQKTMNQNDGEFYNKNTDNNLQDEIYYSIGSDSNGFKSSDLESNKMNEEIKAEIYSWLDYRRMSSPKDLYAIYAPLSYEKNWFLRTLSFRKAIEGSLRHKSQGDIEAQFPLKETLI